MTRGLPVAEEDAERIVLHVDADCFYASCERLREPALRGEPVVVGMGYEEGDDGGAVATASYEARAHGVESAQAITTALERLPRRGGDGANVDGPAGYYRPVDMAFYEEVAADVRGVLHDLGDTVREVSIDEAYMDVTDRTDWSVVEGFARHVKQRVAREAGVTVSVGAAPTMSAAKVASDADKPDGLVVVQPGEVREFFAPLDTEAVHGIGPVTARELREMGIHTAGALAEADPDELGARFGERGREVRRRARGEDDREVEPTGNPKSLNRESAFGEATADEDAQRERIRTLAAAVADRAERRGALYRTIGVKAVEPPFEVNTRARSLSGPVADADLVREVAQNLFGEFAGDEIRKVGVRVSNLSFAEADQATLGGFEGGDTEHATRAARTEREGDDGPEGQVSLDDF